MCAFQSKLIFNVISFIATVSKEKKKNGVQQVPPLGGNEGKGIRSCVVALTQKARTPSPCTQYCRGRIITLSCHHLRICLLPRFWKHCQGPNMRGKWVWRYRKHNMWGGLKSPGVCHGRSPGNGGNMSAVLVDEVATSVEHPAVVQRHEGVSCCGGRVLCILAVCVFQRGELVLPQDLVHHKLPVGIHHTETMRMWHTARSSLQKSIPSIRALWYKSQICSGIDLQTPRLNHHVLLQTVLFGRDPEKKLQL